MYLIINRTPKNRQYAGIVIENVAENKAKSFSICIQYTYSWLSCMSTYRVYTVTVFYHALACHSHPECNTATAYIVCLSNTGTVLKCNK